MAIVRALAMKPDLLLLDEITSALDPELVAEVLDVIRELAAGGMTMVIATHEMGFARDIANRVCFLDGGRILEQGPPAQIFARAARGPDPPVPQPDHRGGPPLARGCAGCARPRGSPSVPIRAESGRLDRRACHSTRDAARLERTASRTTAARHVWNAKRSDAPGRGEPGTRDGGTPRSRSAAARGSPAGVHEEREQPLELARRGVRALGVALDGHPERPRRRLERLHEVARPRSATARRHEPRREVRRPHALVVVAVHR